MSQSVHNDLCSRHWLDFEYTSRHVSPIGPPVDGYVAFLFDLISSCACARFSSSWFWRLFYSQVRHSLPARHTLNSTVVDDSLFYDPFAIVLLVKHVYWFLRLVLLFDGPQNAECLTPVESVDSSSLTVFPLDILIFSMRRPSLSMHLLSDVLHVVDSSLCFRSSDCELCCDPSG